MKQSANRKARSGWLRIAALSAAVLAFVSILSSLDAPHTALAGEAWTNMATFPTDSCSAESRPGGCRSPIPSTQDVEAERQLAEKFAPIVFLKEQEEDCDKDGEPYEPIEVEIVLGNSSVSLREDSFGQPIAVEAPEASDLFGVSDEFYLDYPGNPTVPRCRYEEDYKELRESFTSVAYAHVTQEPGFRGIAVQYWFFYYFNDWNNTHEGDWEMIQLAFDADSASEALGQEPARVAYAQHNGGERADWNDGKVKKQDGRPIVYVAVGSHASQYTPGVYLGLGENDTGFGCDDTSGPHRVVPLEAVLIPDQVSDPNDALAWTTFAGRWGENKGGHFSGPTGPTTKDKWTQPFTWEEGLRKSSVKIPERSALGPPAVNVFCDVVGISSTLLSWFKQWPLVVGGAGGLAFVIMLGLVGTAYFSQPRSLPGGEAYLPLVRRRHLGQLLRAARGLYRSAPRTFLGIAAVFVPLGLLASGIQRFAYQNPPVEQILALFDNSVALQVALALAVGGLQTLVATNFVGAAVVAAVGQAQDGQRPDFRRAYGLMIERFWIILRARLLVTWRVGIVAVTLVGIPWAIRRGIRWAFLEQAIILENATSAREALEVSAKPVVGRGWRTMGITLLVWSTCWIAGPIVGTLLLFLTPASVNFINGVSSLLYTALLPFAMIVSTLLYYDLRARDAEETSNDEQP